ncbi:MAG: hypothetical protein COA74_03230 [Gammaproteobacteria bacterium]|nr:MAG: hypothetical protein COA74_03230 [Gammaproteobacteria bacterium]
MDKKFDRLRRQQQRLWRKAAVSILSLHHNIAILMAFLMITVLGIFWVLVDQKLEDHLIDNARAYGYGISQYSTTDLKELILSEDKASQELYLHRLTADPLILEARLYNQLGTLLAITPAINTQQADPNLTTDNLIGDSVGNSFGKSIEPKNGNSLTLLEDIKDGTQALGILQLEIDRNLQEAPTHKLLNLLAIFTVVMMIIAVILVWFITKRLTRSLRKLLKFPINSPEEKIIHNLDVGSELKHMLESSTSTSDSPAPVSRAEESGIHQLLAADSIAKSGEVIILRLYLPELSKWLKPASGAHNVGLLRKLDRLLIMTIHSQQGHLLSFDGITAQACFGLDGNLDSAVYRSVSCSLLMENLLTELSLSPKISLRQEQRLLIRHMKRTPVAIATTIYNDDKELLLPEQQPWLVLHDNISQDKRLADQMMLSKITQNWHTIDEITLAAQSMIERQLTWIRYLLVE